MNITKKDLESIDGAEVVGAERLKGVKISGVSTDSRSVEKGNVFFAIKGENFDGHEFVGTVLKSAPAAVVVERAWIENNALPVSSLRCALVVVPDTTKAYGALARIYRRKFSIPVIGIAGSNGKTTTKEMVSSVLERKYRILKTEGNFNNHIGVPKTLFRLRKAHEAAVVELGTNHFGELRYICEIAEPTHGVITNIGKEHLEFFGDENGVAQEELELFHWLFEHNGVPFINSDDRFLKKETARFSRGITYGRDAKAQLRAVRVNLREDGTAAFQLKGKKTSFSVQLAVPGLHNVSNALSAAAAGIALRVPGKSIQQSLESFTSSEKRMQVLHYNGAIILNDTYNANPDSVIVALQTLQSFRKPGKKIAVLGDMRELGDASKREHTNIGVIAAEMHIDRLFTVGQYARYMCEAFGVTGARHYDSKDALSNDLKKEMQPDDVVLVKGSRGMKMEDVVYQLIDKK